MARVELFRRHDFMTKNDATKTQGVSTNSMGDIIYDIFIKEANKKL